MPPVRPPRATIASNSSSVVSPTSRRMPSYVSISSRSTLSDVRGEEGDLALASILRVGRGKPTGGGHRPALAPAGAGRRPLEAGLGRHRGGGGPAGAGPGGAARQLIARKERRRGGFDAHDR